MTVETPPDAADVAGSVPGFTGHGRKDTVLPDELVQVDDHLEELLALVAPLEPIRLHPTEALGQVIVEPIIAHSALPSFANSAMDGYAVVAEDTADATLEDPAVLEVRGEITAGASSLPVVHSGDAVRIMTGAPLPPGATAVVPVENTSVVPGRVRVHVAASADQYIRTVGQDVKPGDRLLEPGRRVSPADVGLLAALGESRVLCRPQPRVVIFSTGDELVGLGDQMGPGQIRDANGPMLKALVSQLGGVPFGGGRVGDDRRALMDAFDVNVGTADLFVCTGGVSAGTRDMLRDVLAVLGSVTSRKVAMKPGMPQLFGQVQGVPVLGFPGNPVSAFVSFEVFARPVIRRMQGRSDVDRPRVRAVLTEPVSSPKHKRTYVRVRLDRVNRAWEATPSRGQGSHQLSDLAAADGLARIPAHIEQMPAGESVDVDLLVDW